MTARSASALVAWSVALLVLPGVAAAIEAIDANKELRLLEQGKRLPRHISGAKYRVAVFTYEDPDRTGLGDELAALLSREILLYSNVSSIGVLKYEGDLSPSEDSSLSYFDKVDKLTASQETVLSMWGMIRRGGDRLIIDSFVQIPPRVAQEYLSWQMMLPQRMGGQQLRGRVGPDRILVQSLELPLQSAATIRESASSLEVLRATADAGAEIVGRIQQGAVFWFGERRGDWVYVDSNGGTKGWVRAAPECPGACAKLRDASRFSAGVLRYLVDGKAPPVANSLAADARVFRDQLIAVEAVGDPEGFNYSRFVSEHQVGPRGNKPALPGGASFENLRAALRISYTLYQRRASPGSEGVVGGQRIWDGYDGQELAPAFVRDVAFDLAEASQNDPRNLDVLHNLEVLFRYAGDEQRAEKAHAIAAEVAAR